MTTAQPGDMTYLFSRNARIDFHGFVGDPDVPQNTWATLELVGSAGVATVPVLVGPQGPPGQDRAIVKLQFDATVTSAAKLPVLTNTPEDVQKAYIIGPICYVWDGRRWEAMQIGVPGPQGVTPVFHVSCMLLDPDGDQETSVQQTGTPEDPGLLFKLRVPKGPKGDPAPIKEAPDYSDKADEPAVGDLLGWTADGWAPTPPTRNGLGYYNIPQANFRATEIAIGTAVPVGAFTVPAQTFDWKPWIEGHLRLSGIELDADPFTLRVEIRRDSPKGVLCGVGFGTPSTFTQVVPHFATPADPGVQVTASNATAKCPAGVDAVFYVNVVNDGLLGVYHYKPDWTEFNVDCKPML